MFAAVILWDDGVINKRSLITVAGDLVVDLAPTLHVIQWTKQQELCSHQDGQGVGIMMEAQYKLYDF